METPGRYAKHWALRDAAPAREIELNKNRLSIKMLPWDNNQCFVSIDVNGRMHTKCSGFENDCPFKTEFDEELHFCYYHCSVESERGQCENTDAIKDAFGKIQKFFHKGDNRE